MTSPLDAFADQIAKARPRLPHLEEVEALIVQRFGEQAPEDVDQRSAGAAWLIIANLLGSAPQLPWTQALDALKLAGQRLYQGGDVRISQPCPVVYDSGTPCRFVAKGTNDEAIDAWMRAHYATYHPERTWAPVENCARCGHEYAAEDICLRVVGEGPVCADCVGAVPATQCACGKKAALIVRYADGGEAQCYACHARDPRDADVVQSMPPVDDPDARAEDEAGREAQHREAEAPATDEPPYPTPNSVRAGRHTINELRRYRGLPEFNLPDHPLGPLELDRLLRATWAEIERAGEPEPRDASELSPHLVEQIEQGIAEAEAGQTKDLGSFAQYANDGEPAADGA